VPGDGSFEPKHVAVRSGIKLLCWTAYLRLFMN